MSTIGATGVILALAVPSVFVAPSWPSYLLSQVLLVPWLLLLPQVPLVPLFSGAVLVIDADVTMGVMSAAGFSDAALFLGATTILVVTL